MHSLQINTQPYKAKVYKDIVLVFESLITLSKKLRDNSDIVILGTKQKILKTNKQNTIPYLMARHVYKSGILRQHSEAYSRGVLRTQWNICDGVFLQKLSKLLTIFTKSSIVDVRMGSKHVSVF